MDRKTIIQTTEKWIKNQGLRIETKDIKRPWGAFWHIHHEDTALFLQLFFPERSISILDTSIMSPKILMVLPGQRLSMQIHHQRSECWTVLQGPVKIILGNQETIAFPSMHVTIPVATPHRLIGLNSPGLVSEIWLHKDPDNLSTEEDIVRLEDDYQRE